jgi:hypothetical protein
MLKLINVLRAEITLTSSSIKVLQSNITLEYTLV